MSADFLCGCRVLRIHSLEPGMFDAASVACAVATKSLQHHVTGAVNVCLYVQYLQHQYVSDRAGSA